MPEAPRDVLAAGVMSGTSLDGVTAAVVRFEEPAPLDVRVTLLAHHTVPYDEDRRAQLGEALERGGPRELARLHYDVSRWAADAVRMACETAGLAPSQLVFAAAHGQTVWHEPRRATLQLGSPAVLVERLGVPVVSDFRGRDVAAGGEGAPLVPRADRLLFARADAPRVLLNLGGIANLTAVPPRGSDAPLVAFDTGPGVMVVDACVRALFPGRRCDAEGRIAAAGHVVEPVLEETLRHPYFDAPPPKSTGRELFGTAFAHSFVARCLAHSGRPEDAVATATELTARSIGRAARFIPEALAPRDVVRAGGGARNPALAAAVERCWPGPEHRAFEQLYFAGEAKEAVAFAFLGYLTWTGRSGNEPGATGAAGPRLLGSITHP